jgi:hypothetical protein
VASATEVYLLPKPPIGAVAGAGMAAIGAGFAIGTIAFGTKATDSGFN